jgi:replicative DNA helicase
MTAPDDAHTLLEWPVPSITRNMGRVDREIIWIVARESVGKTAFVIQWLLRLGLDGHMVSMASLESSCESVGSRAIANIGELDNFHIRQRSASKGLVERAYKYADTIPKCIRVIDSSMSLDQLYAWGKSEARRGSKLIVIDNTRHITVRGNIDRVNEVAEISSRMKQLRDETQIPVVILHHSTYDAKTGKEDVSWSKDIRRDADVIIFLKADEELTEVPQSPADPGKWAVRFCVDKNREGRKGYDILTRFVKEHQLFREWIY